MDKLFALRPATAADAPAIRALVRAARINPTSLDWRRFVVAVTPDGELLGCGQVKPHGDGSRELASIAVAPEWQGQGIARLIIENLLAAYPGILFLTCRASLGPFYEKYGFRVVGLEEMTPYFHRLMRLASAMGALRLMPEKLLVMRRGRQT